MHLRLLCHCIKVKVGVGRICPISQKRKVDICFRMQVLAYWLLILGQYWFILRENNCASDVNILQSLFNNSAPLKEALSRDDAAI